MKRIAFVALAAIVLAVSPASLRASPTVIATIFLGGGPRYLAVDPSTNRVYVTGTPNGVRLTVIDAATNAPITDFDMGGNGGRLAANPTTSRVYVPIFSHGDLLVVDGSANPPSALTSFAVGPVPEAVGVNPVTNRIYVAKRAGLTDTVSVIDGATNAIIATDIPIGPFPEAVGVNSTTNRVYVANSGDGTVTVIDGTTNSVIATVPLSATSQARDLAVNAATNRVYVADGAPLTLSVIDGATNAVIATVPAGMFTSAVAVDPNVNRIYVVGFPFGGEVMTDSLIVVDGVTNDVIHTLSLGPATRILDSVAVNPSTGLVYVSDANGSVDGRVVLVIPEPAVWALHASALAVLAGLARRGSPRSWRRLGRVA